MTALLLASLLYLPIAPLNPVAQDTLPSLAFHFTGGVAGPNGIVSAGPELSAKCEMLVLHPFVVRGTVDLRYGQTTSNLFPQGHLYVTTVGADAIYYRGTHFLTGYIGFGFLYAFHRFDSFDRTADSLYASEGVADVQIDPQNGYRLILGLRYRRNYSLEVSVSEVRPDFRKIGVGEDGSEVRSYQATRTGSFKVTLGYIVPI